MKKFKFFAGFTFLFAFLSFFEEAAATTYYSRINGGNWNANSSWSTVTYGNATNTGTFPKAGDVANVGDGYTIYLVSSASCATLNIGQGVSGSVEYKSAANYVLTISGNILINTGGSLLYNTATTRTHSCNVAGNFTNYGTVDFYVAAGMIVNITISGNSNSTITGNGSWDLNTVTLNKNTSMGNYADVLTNNFEAGIRTLTLTYGTYIHDNSGTYSVNPSSNFTISQNVIFKVPQGTVQFANSINYILLRGSLVVNGGTVYIGSTIGTQGLYSDQNGTTVPSLDISSGTLNVYGGITNYSTSGSEPFQFTMTGGTINLQSGTTGTAREVFKITDVANSSFTMSGGTINIQKPNRTGSSVIDVSICGSAGSVTTTGGSIVFADNSTPSGKTFTFKPFANATYPSFVVSGGAASSETLRPATGTTENFKTLSLTIEANKTFDIRSVSGATGDSRKMSLMSTSNGTDAFTNDGTFTYRQSTASFNGSASQAVAGSVATDFYDVEINNPAGVSLSKSIFVNDYIDFVSGVLNTTNVNILICNSAANAALGSASSFVDGPMIHTVASSSSASKTYPIGKSSTWRPVVLTVQHSDNTPVTYRSEMFNSAASALPYSLPPTIQNVSDIRHFKFIRQAVSNFVDGTIQIYYDTDDFVLDYTSLRVVQDDGVSAWVDLAGTATANITGNIVSTSFNFFNNYFALANPIGGANPLPVSLVDFNGELNNNIVNLKWTTESEINNDHFIIERSADNETFSPVALVDGKGNSTVTNSYFTIDANPLPGVSYYRLVQVDFNGASRIYGPVSVNFSNSAFRVYPTISNGEYIHIEYAGDKNLVLSVQNSEGKVIPVIQNIDPSGMSLSLQGANAGCYYITASDGQQIFKSRILVMK